jgi:quercetin dioxygenase-like cupin family protein
MLLTKQLDKLGDLNIVICDFEKVGDLLPKHNHTDTDIHVTIVTRGKIKAYSHDWEQVASAGQMLDFRSNEPHELMALEDNTRIFNILKNMVDGTNALTLKPKEQP